MGKVTYKNLTKKQELFAKEYVICGNAQQAAIKAGFSQRSAASTGCRLLKVENVLQLIQQEKELARKNAPLVTLDYVINGLKEVAERCLQRKPVMTFDWNEKQMVQETNEEGEGVWQFDATGANKAFELLGKHLGAFEKDNTGDQPIIKVTVTNNSVTINNGVQLNGNGGEETPGDRSTDTDRGIYPMLPPITE